MKTKFKVGDRVRMCNPSTRIEEEFGMGADGEGLVGTVTQVTPLVQTQYYSEDLLYVDFDDAPELNDKAQFDWRFEYA